MNTLYVYNHIQSILHNNIRHFEILKSTTEGIMTTKAVTSSHIDVMINLYNSFKNYILSPLQIHFYGVTEYVVMVNQSFNINVVGLSFTPWVFYFLSKSSIHELRNNIVSPNIIHIQYE